MPVLVNLWCVAGFLVIAVFAVGQCRKPKATPLIYGASLAVSAIGLFAVLAALLDPAAVPSIIRLPLGLPWLGANFRVDSLSAFFLVIVNLGGGVTSFYAIGYGRHEEAPHRVLPIFPAFLGAMNMVVLADDAFTFLLSWEFMSLASWALVMAHHRDEDNVRAGYVYLVMASFGTLALLLGFGLLAGLNGTYGFEAIRAIQHEPYVVALALILALLGAGSKAGIVPLHVWLPLAHPAAPSHVSALMSGVMTKVAIYGFIRIVFDLVGQPSWWSSIIVLLLGGTTAVLGVLYALMQRDLKRLLAYSTVENVGIIFIGLGLALGFQANGLGWAAALAMTAALFHVLNHSLFKSLLFFGAGAVLNATGERDMEVLGGLMHRMPYTAFLFLVGCAAISALPPLNGFVSEWLTFQAILQSPLLPQWGLKVIIPVAGTMLALAAALAAACFVRAFGVVFLGQPRAEAARQALEVDRFSISAMAFLAVLCLITGTLPGVIIDSLSPVVQGLLDTGMPAQTSIPWLSIIPVTESGNSYNGVLVLAFVALSAGITAYLVHRFASRAIRRGPAWDCGFPDQTPAMQYTASSFAQPLRRVFGTVVFRAREEVAIPPPGDTGPARLTVEIKDLIWDYLYAPIGTAVGFVASKMNHLQFLTIRRYLSFVFGALVTLLLVLAI